MSAGKRNMTKIKYISKFSFQEMKRVELTPGQTTRAHYAKRIESPDKYNSFFLLEPGTDHVYDMFFNWDKFKEMAENMYYRMDFDWCYTADYIEAFGKNPVPQRPYYGFNTVVHGYTKPGGWYKETIDHADVGWTFVDAWALGNNHWTKRYSSKGIYWSTYKWDRIYTKIVDWTPAFDAWVEKYGVDYIK